MNDFEQHIWDAKRRLVIAFAGGPQNRYQFGKTLKDLDVSYVLMRDTTQQYHSHGVAGIGNRAKVIDYIRYFKGLGFYVVTTGVSSGAYAALLYGQLVPADEVIVISPLSGRDTDDFELQYHHRIHDPHTNLDDLRKYFQAGPVSKVRAFVSDGDGTDLDRQMVTRINVTNITLIPGYAHKDLGYGMRDSGLLKELLSGE